ncbi:MAG TPA: ABC transporter permease, partial [Polyangiales bacterium]|nr:ABC transporter permease [Polyangiales bacterium]
MSTRAETASRYTELHEGALHLRGALEMGHAAELWRELRPSVDAAVCGQALDFEMSQVEQVDGGITALLSHLRTELQQRGVKSEFVGASPEVQEIIHLYSGDVRVGPRKRKRARGTLDQIGMATLEVSREAQRVLGFIGQLVLSLREVARSPRSANWRELPHMIERAGADAVPIVLLINFLVGLVMAMQSAVQLKNFGANIFVADLIGISMTRELGPLMTAIVVTGRSGAA